MDELAMKRAAVIHAEGRDLFHFGPPPYSTGIDVSHPPTGRTWVVQIGDHIPLTGVDMLIEMISRCVKADNPEAMAFGLAYVAACSEVGAVAVALEARREVPNG